MSYLYLHVALSNAYAVSDGHSAERNELWISVRCKNTVGLKQAGRNLSPTADLTSLRGLRTFGPRQHRINRKRKSGHT
jgi:hypothetical protein